MVLVDSSVWIEYFRGNESVLQLNNLIETNNICINDLILAELIPSIIHKNEDELKELLMSVTKIRLDINWNQIMQMQIENLRNGINKVGVADLIIAQNAIDNDLALYAVDKHFPLMSTVLGIRLYN
jgi:predicted nucleic acid-binding protein